MAVRRYWRIWIPVHVDNHSIQNWAEFRFYDSAPSSYADDVCTGGAAIGADLVGGTYANLFDNDAVTWSYWNEGVGWVGYDLGVGNEKDVSHVSLTQRNPTYDQYAGYFEVQSSTDGLSWDTEWTVTAVTPWSNGESRTYQSDGTLYVFPLPQEFSDDFESGNFALWDMQDNPVIVTASTYGMEGDYAVRLFGGTYWLQRYLLESNEYFFTFLFRPEASNSERILKVLNGSTVLCSLYRTNNTSGQFKAYSGDGATLLATSTVNTIVSSVYTVQVNIKIDDTAGRFVVIQDDVTVIDFTGDTKPGAEINIDSFIIGAVSGEPNFVMDNIVASISVPVETPVILPTSGAYQASQSISITCATPDSTIYYTEDGSDPDNTDTEYTAPFTLGSAKTIKAIGIKTGQDDSGIVSETYTIGALANQPIINILT